MWKKDEAGETRAAGSKKSSRSGDSAAARRPESTASPADPPATLVMLKALRKAIDESGSSEERVVAYYKVATLDELKVSQAQEALRLLQDRSPATPVPTSPRGPDTVTTTPGEPASPLLQDART